MTATAEFDITAPPGPRGRTIKFTPERLQQIRNLVERGMSREDIAATIGVTVGSLQVTCSRLGISLRRPKTTPVGPVPAAPAVDTDAAPALVLRMRHGGRFRDFAIPVTMEALSTLALAAAVKGLSIGDVLAKALTVAIKDGVS